jgi:transposase
VKLVPDWKNAWRWISMHAMTYAAALQVTWASIDQEMRDKLPDNLVLYLTFSLLFLGIIGRLVKQKDQK